MEYWEAQAKAEQCYLEGDFVTSLEYYKEAFRTIPDDYQRRYAVISLYIGKARSHLGMQAAYETLEDLARDDYQGIYMGYPEYYETLIECQKRLGHDTRNAENQLSELNLHWKDALSHARDLLDKGDYEESLIFFERSLNSNPGEWYSMNDVYDAFRGKAEALTKLNRHKEAKACLKRIPPDR
jgi:tetratricopeptide (TPR) repeat protein